MSSLCQEMVANLSSAVAGDERNLAILAVRVHNFTRISPYRRSQSGTQQIILTVQEPHELLSLHARTDLDADRVPDPAEVLDVRAVELPRAVADPEEVSGGVVVHFAGSGLGRG